MINYYNECLQVDNNFQLNYNSNVESHKMRGNHVDTKKQSEYTVTSGCQFVTRQVGEQHILVSVGAGIERFNGYLTMNDTALFLWKLMADGIREEELILKLMKEYSIEEEVAAQDVDQFLMILLDNGIIEETKDE